VSASTDRDLRALFVVVREHVYDQGVVGIAQTQEAAERIAETAAARQKDSYHSFSVRVWRVREFDEEVAHLGQNEVSGRDRVWVWDRKSARKPPA